MAQTFRDFELILVNDGSTDGSAEICQDYADNFEQIRVIHQENQGLSMSRNVGLLHAVGDYISFVDSDDWLDPSFLETLWEAVQRHQTPIAVTGYLYFDEHTDKFRFPYSPTADTEKVYAVDEWLQFDGASHYYHTVFTAAWGKLYAREVFEGITYPKGKLSEDELTTYKLYLMAGECTFVDKHLYIYTQRETSITKSPAFRSLVEQPITVLEERIALLSLLGFDTKQQQEVYRERLEYARQETLKQGFIELYKEIDLKLRLVEKYKIVDK